ncbi:hypothetical protein [Cohnella silvisoli]|uniref:ABM domain-containing protein n=1 Tax=Cohnella silvisoli TaxID=2873699 RepID=A0ABV1KZ52_9BACL|nr:hypothetical protein [Cohnella silvisoli]MCD9024676.1 hypothetical protein [Cohnella silvisoli]
MEQKNQQYVMEIVLFELKEGTDKLRFCKAATALSEVLQNGISGFKGRTLLHTPNEIQWTDIIYWSDMEMALAAMEQLKSVPAFQNFVSMIDSREITQRHLIPINLSM